MTLPFFVHPQDQIPNRKAASILQLGINGIIHLSN
jgi:hypothetical protein